MIYQNRKNLLQNDFELTSVILEISEFWHTRVVIFICFQNYPLQFQSFSSGCIYIYNLRPNVHFTDIQDRTTTMKGEYGRQVGIINYYRGKLKFSKSHIYQ